MNRKLFLAAALIGAVIFTGCRSYSSYRAKLSSNKTVNKIKPLRPEGDGGNYKRIFDNEITNNISQIAPADTFKLDRNAMGVANYRLLKDKSTKSPIWLPICIITSIPFRVPAMVGIPVGHHKAKVQLAVDVKDGNGNLVKTYTAKGKHISFVTGWWGYKKDDARYKAHDKAFAQAMSKIKNQMDADASLLNSKLSDCLLSEDEILANKFIRQGDAEYEKKNYLLATQSYSVAAEKIKSYKKYHAQFLYKMGFSYIDLGTPETTEKAIKYIKQALELDPKVDYMAPVGLYLAYKGANDPSTAATWLDYTINNFPLNAKQKELLNEWKTECLVAAPQIEAGALLKNKPVNVTINNLGPNINSKESDYFPSVTADESMLLFTSRRPGSTGGLGTNGMYDEDLWYCDKKEDGSWSMPKNFGTPVNTKNNNGIASFTGDGQLVVCGRCNEPDGVGSCDIYGAQLVGNTWKEPVNMGTMINSKDWDAQVSISVDGKTLVWSSNRPGGRGNEDLWISYKKEDGKWTEPKNLGPLVNTSGSEYSPYLHPDGKTLYFSSDNLSPRIGGEDIYKTTIKEDGTCTVPENLGYPINSEYDDLYFVLTPSGLKGYFGSKRPGGYGGDDIYEIVFPQEMKSKLVAVDGHILNDETRQPLEANIKIEDLDSAKVIGEYVSNSATGKFVVILTPGHNYGLTVSKNGYLFYSENFNIPVENEFKEVKKEVLLQQIKEGKKIVLNNIFFETAKSVLTESSFSEINKLYDLLNQNPEVKVEISGHTDNVG
ncbi:MAG: hypothetical protein ACXVC7_12190, partial [Bacteroidia bacterium]